MTTFKAEVYAHQKRSDGTYNIKIRVTHNRRKKYVPTVYYATKDDLTRGFKIKNQFYIDGCEEIIRGYRHAVEQLGESAKAMTAEQIVDHITRGAGSQGFSLDIVQYGRRLAARMREKGREGNAKVYEVALNSLVRFTGRECVDVREITGRFVQEWIEWIGQQPSPSGRPVPENRRAKSLYPATVRAIFNAAKAEFNDEDNNIISIPNSPFRNLPKAPTTDKLALGIETIRSIAALADRSSYHRGNNRFSFARDMFLLSFCLIGINEADLFTCTSLKDGFITYERTKTRNRRADRAAISVKLQPQAERLLERYRDPDGKRVFGFYRMYRSVNTFTYAINKGLKLVGEAVGLEEPLKYYAARHSWATLAVNDMGIDKYVVHSALNHVDEDMKVTDIYIKRSFEAINKANAKVLNRVFGKDATI